MKEVVYCGAPTRTGQPCRARIAGPGQTRCTAHGGRRVVAQPLPRCGVINNRGLVCWQRVREEGLHCRWHGGPSRLEQESASP